MLSLEDVLDKYKSNTLDGRDINRLMDFVPMGRWDEFGVKLNEGIDPSTIKTKEWTEENIIKQLAKDVDFGFEKALDRRGISSGLMYEVVKMWMWVLEDDLQHMEDYAMYGLPLFKAVAVKYGFENQIGDADPSSSEFGDDD